MSVYDQNVIGIRIVPTPCGIDVQFSHEIPREMSSDLSLACLIMFS
jgi:hypothetical protein